MVAVAGVTLEALSLTVLAAWWVVGMIRVGSQAPAVGISLVVFCLAMALVLVAASRALVRGARRARSLVVTWQLLQGAVAASMVQAGVLWAWAVVAVSVVVVVLMMTRPVAEHTGALVPRPEETRPEH
ncbi:hypothetical protein N869_03025 [Cellulomonas bogoriensis 69B4 = DSM 16987]|uniref:Histidine kinase n=1 Tax=Cellulomonas bogoriensis 69B4 = DSM 16987 TaxID=1386082 RepID=A0A0A0BTI7_9CELL|nr:hypothetical protein N869_03025 [Cellulomonas bogoriensis 69B4 = DSM 16987]